MNPILKAAIGGLVRGSLFWLGGHGVDVHGMAGDQLADALNALLNALLVIVPALWTVWHKYRVHDRIVTAEAEAQVASKLRG